MSTGAAEPSEMSVHYFRGLVESQTQKLEELCDKWTRILEYKSEQCSEPAPPTNGGQQGDQQQQQEEEEEEDEEARVDEEDTCGAIRSTIGKAKLLVSQRFSQFSSLIDDCEFKRSQLPTRLEDLLGFWEMIDCQVKDVLSGFEKLNKSSLNGHSKTTTN